MATGRKLLSICMPSRFKQTLLCPVRTLQLAKTHGTKAKNAGHTRKEGQTKVRRMLDKELNNELYE